MKITFDTIKTVAYLVILFLSIGAGWAALDGRVTANADSIQRIEKYIEKHNEMSREIRDRVIKTDNNVEWIIKNYRSCPHGQ